MSTSIEADDSTPIPDASTLLDLLDLLNLEHEPFVRRFSLVERTPQFVRTLRRIERAVEIGAGPRQRALCNFHLGLFNLHWKESISSHYFQQAARNWQLTPLAPLTCLAFLGEGSAWHQACDYEAAMLAYMRARTEMTRLLDMQYIPSPITDAKRLYIFLDCFENILARAEVALRNSLGDIDPPVT